MLFGLFVISTNIYHFRQFGVFPPPLYTSHIPPALGRPLKQNEIFDVLDSKFVNVFPENEFNKFLDEVEVETIGTYLDSIHFPTMFTFS